MKIDDFFLKITRKLYPASYNLNVQLSKEYTDTINQSTSDLIYDRIMDDKPLMISRFGSTELNCLVNYMTRSSGFKSYVDYITGKTNYYKWDARTLESMCTLSGFFPPSYDLLEDFSKLLIHDARDIDILGSWLKEEVLLDKHLQNPEKVGLRNLEPYNHKNPWSRALEGKNVLVIHPFEKSIIEQYKRREFLFQDKRVLPEFKLKTIKAIQTISNNKTSFKNWFEALDNMKGQINDMDFDIAIIGCGAYGMPLAAHIKRIGKKAVHLGGATQILFGVWGKRWETEYDYGTRFMNDNWARPMKEELPQDADKVEEACYW